MHTMLRVTMNDVHATNDAINDGRLSTVFQNISKLINPRAHSFTQTKAIERRSCCLR